ncbi:hypothetical protein [Kutzneria sp. 744]|uniref:hypothetical protein n=1 Tax=Kutzneria sp. (strain 744) TaxID=345341 RepID=UPI0003EEB113|nr:hypothetical protein [Kutzneria sp. 744]EWM17529.1 hypothetical protein KUTG_07833 [Kutzneria sp. 744]
MLTARLLGVAGAAALVMGGFGSGVAQAESAPGCSSTVQIGSTAYIMDGSQTAASVKQFKGCGQNWGYVYVWTAYLAKHSGFYVFAAIGDGGEPIGLVRGDKNQREVWSYGTNTLNVCTWAVGDIDFVGGPMLHQDTGKRC